MLTDIIFAFPVVLATVHFDSEANEALGFNVRLDANSAVHIYNSSGYRHRVELTLDFVLRIKTMTRDAYNRATKHVATLRCEHQFQIRTSYKIKSTFSYFPFYKLNKLSTKLEMQFLSNCTYILIAISEHNFFVDSKYVPAG